jgi:hypothetical protein
MTDLPTRATMFTNCRDAPAVSLQPMLGAGSCTVHYVTVTVSGQLAWIQSCDLPASSVE